MSIAQPKKNPGKPMRNRLRESRSPVIIWFVSHVCAGYLLDPGSPATSQKKRHIGRTVSALWTRWTWWAPILLKSGHRTVQKGVSRRLAFCLALPCPDFSRMGAHHVYRVQRAETILPICRSFCAVTGEPGSTRYPAQRKATERRSPAIFFLRWYMYKTG